MIWDITQPRDNWEIHFAHMNYLWTGLHIMITGKKIKVSHED